MASANELSVKILVDGSQLAAGMSQATATVQSASDSIATALAKVSPAATNMAASLKAAGMSAVDAASAMKNLGFSAKETAAAVGGAAVALNEAGPAAEVAARGVNNARAAMMGLNREIGLGGNRALSTFIQQSEMIGPVLNKAFTGIAIAGFIQLAVLAGEKLSALIADTFILTKAEKDLYGQLVSDNQKIAALNDQIAKQMRDFLVLGKPLAEQERMRAKWAMEDMEGSRGSVTSAERRLALLRQQLVTLEAQAAQEKKNSDPNVANAMEPISPLGGETDAQVEKTRQAISSLESTIGLLRKQYDSAALSAEELTKKADVTGALKAAEAQKKFAAALEESSLHQRTIFEKNDKLAADQAEFALKESSKEIEAATKAGIQISEAERKFNEERLKDAEELSIAKIASLEKAVEEELRLGKITADQARTLLNKLVADKLAIELKYVTDRQSVILARLNSDDAKTYAEDLAAWSKLLHDKQQAQIKADAAIQTNNNNAANTHQKVWSQAFANMNATFSRTIGGLVTGTQNFKTAFTRMAEDMTAKFIEAMARQAMEWVATHVFMLAIKKSEQAKEVLIDAKEGAAAAWKAVVGIPFIGPILAPIAAATAFAGIMAFSAEGGMVVPGSGALTMLHPHEMVLPADISKGVQSAIGRGAFGGGSSQGGGDIHVHYSPQISAIDARGMREALKGHADTIAALLRQHQREFKI